MPIAILIAVLIVAGIGAGIYYSQKNSPSQTEENSQATKEQGTSSENFTDTPASSKGTTPVSSSTTKGKVTTSIPAPLPCGGSLVPTIVVNSPSNGQTYFTGGQMTVHWEKCNFPSNTSVNITLETSNIGPSQSTTLMANTPNDEREVVAVPTSLVAGQYWVKIVSSTPSASDFSDSPINISTGQSPSLSVLSPNGGEIFQQGSNITVTWSSVNIPTTASIIISLARTNATGVNVYPLSGDTPNDHQETFHLPALATPGSYKVLIGTNSYSSNDSLGDESDALFIIQ